MVLRCCSPENTTEEENTDNGTGHWGWDHVDTWGGHRIYIFQEKENRWRQNGPTHPNQLIPAVDVSPLHNVLVILPVQIKASKAWSSNLTRHFATVHLPKWSMVLICLCCLPRTSSFALCQRRQGSLDPDTVHQTGRLLEVHSWTQTKIMCAY